MHSVLEKSSYSEPLDFLTCSGSIKLNILSFLELKDMGHLAQVNRAFRFAIIKDFSICSVVVRQLRRLRSKKERKLRQQLDFFETEANKMSN